MPKTSGAILWMLVALVVIGCTAQPGQLPTPVSLAPGSGMRATVSAEYAQQETLSRAALEATVAAQTGWAALATYETVALQTTIEAESMTRQADEFARATAGASLATQEALAAEGTRVAMYAVATQAALSANATQTAYAMQYAQATYSAESTRVSVEQQRSLLEAQMQAQRQDLMAHQKFQYVLRWVVLVLVAALTISLIGLGIWVARKWVLLREQATEPYRLILVDGRERLLVVNPAYREEGAPTLLPANASSPVIEEDAPASGVLAALARAKCILLVGAQDTGKTTFALHLVASRMETAQIVVIDPKPRTPWPAGVEVVGRGYVWAQIGGALRGMLVEMEQRYRLMRENRAYEPSELVVVVDEWASIATNVEGATDALKRLVFEAREAGIRLLLMSQSDDVTTLGIRGQGRLREAFVVVYLTKGREGDRLARVVWPDNTEETYAHPGAFRPIDGRPQQARQSAPVFRWPTRPVEEQLPELRLTWLDQVGVEMEASRRAREDAAELIKAGPFDTRNAAAVALFGVARASQNEYERLASALRWVVGNRPESLQAQPWLRKLALDAGLSFGD